MIIDSHVHIGIGERLDDTYQIECTTEKIISCMDEAGVDKSCIMPVTYEDYEPGIQEVREAVAAYPDRLIGYARVNLNSPERAFEQVRRCFEQYNFRAVKLLSGGFPTRPFMEMLSEYGRPLLLHGSTDMEFIDAVSRLARAYPRVPVICAHMGGFGSNVFWPGFVKLYAVEAKQIPNLYLDTAFVLLHQWIGMAVEICGPEKVLFGSDAPILHPAVVLKQIELCHFTASEQKMILETNARKLLGV